MFCKHLLLDLNIILAVVVYKLLNQPNSQKSKAKITKVSKAIEFGQTERMPMIVGNWL